MALSTGGSLSTKLIGLVGKLDEQKTLANIRTSIISIEKQMQSGNNKIKLYAEVFGRMDEIRKNITALQAKIDASSQIGKIKLGVELKNTSGQEINKEIKRLQAIVDGNNSSNKMKLNLDVNTKDSSQKVTAEMRKMNETVDQYAQRIKSKDIVNMDKDAENVSKNTRKMSGSIGGLDRDTKQIGSNIEAQMNKATGATGRFSVTFQRDVNGAITGANASINTVGGAVEKMSYSLDRGTNSLVMQSRQTKELSASQLDLERVMKQVEGGERRLNDLRQKSPKGMNDELIKRAEGLMQTARSLDVVSGNTGIAKTAMSELNIVMSQMDKNIKLDKAEAEMKKLRAEIQQTITQMEGFKGSSTAIEQFNQKLNGSVKLSTADLTKLRDEAKRTAKEFEESQRVISQSLSVSQRGSIRSAINDNDINALKRYTSSLLGANTETVKLTHTNDNLGRAVDRLKVNMQAQNGVVKSYTLDIDKNFNGVDGSIRKIDESSKNLKQTNDNLGGSFTQIIGRVTQYFSAVRILQTSMRLLRSTMSEILEINASMTDLSRVAAPFINIDVLLRKSIDSAKELGSSVNGILTSVAEMARTFGEFNEEQLIAIARTATIMTNVSDLDIGQATSTLVGTMQAFNITAEDSIRIVNSLNEVDNNYAISTQQLGTAMSKSGATAKTFGVEMEQLAGDITAVGAVTQESGDRIGTALRTIYSRVTTLKDSREILQALGISLYNMTENGAELRNTSDILGDLGEKWSTLSAEMQQNVGVTIAGRNRLTQFLALMNNQQMAIDATTTAYNSQGSAMREQAEYMKSYEYQMNVMKSTATELALTMEDKLVGDVMYLVINGLTDLMDATIDIVDKFGLLAPVLGIAGLAFAKFGGGTALVVTQLDRVWAFFRVNGLIGGIKQFGSMLLGVASSSKIASISVATLGTALKGLLASTLIGAGFMAVGWAIEKLIGHFADAKKASAEAEEAVKNALDAYNAQGQDISGLIDRYEKLNKAMRDNADAMSPEQQREYNDLINQISTILPQSVDYIDAQGQAHLRTTEYIREQVSSMDELAKANAEMVTEGNSEQFQEQVKSLQEIVDRVEKYRGQVDSFGTTVTETYEEFSKRMKDMGADASVISETQFNNLRNSEIAQNGYAKATSNLINSQYMLSSEIQKTTVDIGDNVITLMRANGQLENISSAGEAMIRNFASNNSNIIENSDDVEQAVTSLMERNKEFGEITERVYSSFANDLNDIDSAKAVEAMDNLTLALPKEFWDQSMEDMSNGMSALGNVVSEVSNNASLDVNGLIQTLEASGIESDIAKEIVINLGQAFENQAIQSAVAQEDLAQYNDELAKTTELAFEAIDPLEQLFGISSGDTKAIESHVAGLQILRQQYGDTWAEMDRAEPSIQALAGYFGQSEQFIRDNVDKVGLAVRTISQAKQEWDEETKTYKMAFDESVDESTKKLVMSFLDSGDSYLGFANAFATNTGVVMQNAEQVEAMAEAVDQRFQNFFNNPADSTQYELLLGTLNEQLKELDGTFIAVEDSAGNVKLSMADGTESAYLNTINTQVDKMGQQFTVTYDEFGDLLLLIGEEGQEARTLTTLTENAQEGDLAVQALKSTFSEFRNGTLNEEEEATFFTMLKNQIEAFGGEMVTVTDEAGNLKLQMAEEGKISPWLDALNGQLEAGGIKVEEVKDELGNLGIQLSTEADGVFFNSLGTGMDLGKGKVEEVQEAVGKLDEKIRGGSEGTTARPIAVDNDSAMTKVGDVGSAVDKISEKEINLKISEDTMNNNNKVVESLTNTKAELMTLEEKLAKLNADLAVAGESVGTIMNNVKGLTDIRNSVQNMVTDLETAKSRLSELYQLTRDTNVDTSGITNSAEKIKGSVDAIVESMHRIRATVFLVNSAISSLRFEFDIAPMMNFSNITNGHLLALLSRFEMFKNGVHLSLGQTESAYMNNLAVVERFRGALSLNLDLMHRHHRELGINVVNEITKMAKMSTSVYMDGNVAILSATGRLKNTMSDRMKSMNTETSSTMRLMSRNMVTIFDSAITKIVSSAGTIPNRIGRAIRDNMAESSGAMDALANNMIRRFKTTLGIHSPSRVFHELGGFVMEGLVNGLSDSNITDLGQNVFSEFSNNAITSLDQIKGYMTFEPTTSGTFGSGFRRSSGFGLRKSPGGVGSTNHRGVDYAAPAGTPIKSNVSGTVVANGYNGVRGNYISVRSGNAIHTYQHNSSNHVGVGQTVGKGQVLGTVGSTGASTGAHLHYEVKVNGQYIDPEKKLKGFRGFANGGFVDEKELAWHGEEGLEAIIPLTSGRKDRGMDLWKETGQILGMNEDLLKLVMQSSRKTSSSGSGSSFGALGGETGGGSDEGGTSGDVRPDFSGVIRSMVAENDQPMFGAMADKKELDSLYKRDMDSVRMDQRNAMLTQAGTILSGLTKETLKYRNALEEVNYQERLLRNETDKQLKQTVQRQKAIESELGKLRNTGKHTEAQRKKYNDLQQEFDNNTKSIYNMENELKKLNISMDERKLEIYSDYLGQITQQYENFTKGIQRTIASLEYTAELNALKQPDNIGQQLNDQYKILEQNIKLQKTYQNGMNSLQSEYNKAVSKYGKDSDQARSVQGELWNAQANYRKSVLDNIKLENSIEDTRKDVASESIKSLKDYYKQTQSMTEKAIELERKSLEKSHANKMSMYDEEIDKIKSVYDERMNTRDEENEEKEYQAKINELNQERIDLMNQISRASRDDSLEGRKRLADYQSELAGINQEILESQTSRQDTLYKREMEKQRDAQIQAIESKKEQAEKESQIVFDALDKQAEEAKKYAENMINDEARWDKIQNDFASGKTDGLVKLMEEMTGDMAQFMSGNFNGIAGFSNLSKDDKSGFNEDVFLEISNLMFNASKNLEQFSSTANTAVRDVSKANGMSTNSPVLSNNKNGSTSTQGNTTPTIKAPPAPKPAPKPKEDNRYHTIKKGDTLWDLAKKYYNNPYQWNKIAQANASPDPRKLQIGRKMLIPFDTGGFTGDWGGNDGRLAVLHKKELVLNERQTSDILNVASIIEKVVSAFPQVTTGSSNNNPIPSGGSSGDTFQIENIILQLDGVDQKSADKGFDNMLKTMKKRGATFKKK